MGNKIITRNGVSIDLGIPASISSIGNDTTDFVLSDTNSSHVTRAKLKVFFIGNTGDIRVFTKEFSEKLISTLPGSPVVAYFNEEEDDFNGHNDEQYVYGYVPEDATPEFVQENGKTWAVVDVYLFTERKDNIGDVARKIIGKAQSLELNPDTVDWELIYVNDELKKIVFKDGSFYGLSVLGEKQQPAFEGAGFFTKEICDKIKGFKAYQVDDGGKHRMNKTEFLSLGIGEKIGALEKIIREKNVFDDFYVSDFTEEEVIIKAYSNGRFDTFAAPIIWHGDANYEIGDFYSVIPSYVKKNDSSSSFKKKEEEETSGGCGCAEGGDDPQKGGDNDNEGEGKEDVSNPNPDSNEGEGEANNPEGGDAAVEGTEGADGAEGSDAGADAGTEGAVAATSLERGTDEEKETTDSQKEQMQAQRNENKEVTTNASALSSEERNELNSLRKEKKMALISQYKEFLNEEELKAFNDVLDDISLNDLEKELKIKSFDANKERLQKNSGDATHYSTLPNVTANSYKSNIDRLVAENL